jgi:hypothetical protein
MLKEETEKLFLNTLAFEFPKKPVTFYFSLEDRTDCRLTMLKKHNLFPQNIKDIFPDIAKSDTLFTSFDKQFDGLLPLAVDFRLSENYFLVKRFYNRRLSNYLKSRGLFVEPNHITKDNQVWKLNNHDNDRHDCDPYDRFTLKVDYDHFNRRPQLILSFDRPALVYKTSVETLLTPADTDPFSPSEQPQATADLVNRVLYEQPVTREDGTVFTVRRIDKHKYLSENWQEYNTQFAYPIMNRKLAAHIGFDDETDEEKENANSQYADFMPKNRYKKYYDKIKYFYQTYLNNADFRALFPIAKDGFSWIGKTQAGHTKIDSKVLVFGGGATELNPQIGVNNGPFNPTPSSNIQLICIFPKDDITPARQLLSFFRDGYKNKYFAGLKKYTGKDFSFASSDLHIQFSDKKNPIPEIENFLYNANQNQKIKSDVSYLALYLTPISKYATSKEDRKIYYFVKELLLQYNIASQCIETQKMLKVLSDDETLDYKGQPKKNFAYTLQNMAIAINAKLGGTPWRINTPKQDELVVGVGAFRNSDTHTQYIGSAFSFDNTGAFNSFEYFQKDELKELAGSIKNAIMNFSSANGIPERLVIHYYKEMSLVREYPHIEKVLQELEIDIPVYIVTINKIESESIVLFDGKNPDLMPYSGRFINLGNKTYLLCNNTRYENAVFRKMDGYPFPVKIKIECPNNTTQNIDTQTINNLIDQIYQFSRIYWKSVKQQNLPITIKYPEMIAQMMPYFNNTSIDFVDTKHLWFL